MKKLASVAAGLLLTFSASAFAASLEGKISKVEDEGGKISVTAADGKETSVKISGKRTELSGVKDRSELKVGRAVAIEHEGGEAKKLTAK